VDRRTVIVGARYDVVMYGGLPLELLEHIYT
jgi:hypothetical protein